MLAFKLFRSRGSEKKKKKTPPPSHSLYSPWEKHESKIASDCSEQKQGQVGRNVLSVVDLIPIFPLICQVTFAKQKFNGEEFHHIS